MKRNEKTIVVISILLIVLATTILFVPNISSTLKTILQIGLLALFALVSNALLKPVKVNRGYAKIAAKAVAIILIAALIVGFNLGLIIGFSKTFFPPTAATFFLGFLPTLGLIVASEFLRKILVGSAYESKFMLALITIALAIVGIFAEISAVTISSIDVAFITTCTIILPILAEGSLSTYMMKRAGMAPTLMYRCARGLYLYILPIAPVFSQYLYSVMWVVVPFLIYRLVKRDLPDEIVKQGGKIDKSKNNVKRNFSILAIPTAMFIATAVVLISGILRFKMVAIASGSMAPTFDRGDAIIYDKEGELEVGDVMAFMHGGNIVTHRIVKIRENGKRKVYYTKGDANNTEDNYEVVENLVLGKVSLVVKYIGLPTVWFNEAVGNL